MNSLSSSLGGGGGRGGEEGEEPVCLNILKMPPVVLHPVVQFTVDNIASLVGCFLNTPFLILPGWVLLLN